VIGKGKCERIVFVVSDVMTEVEYHMASSSPIFTARTDGALHGRSYGNVSCGGSGTKTVRPPFMERALCCARRRWQRAGGQHDARLSRGRIQRTEASFLSTSLETHQLCRSRTKD